MNSYTFSPNAVLSLNDIENYTLSNFGKIQTKIYLSKLHEAIVLIANNPKVGKLRTDLFKEWECYSYLVGSHTIYYEIVSDNEINIIDILHQSMEPERHILED